MPIAVVARQSLAGQAAEYAALLRRNHPKMTIVVQGSSNAFEVPFAPNEVTTESLAAAFETIARGGREPLLIEGAKPLPTMSFDLVIAHRDLQDPIEGMLTRLRNLAASGDRIRVKLDQTAARGLWRMTSYTQRVLARQHGTNDATRAICSFTFTAVSDPAKEAGPASGGAAPGGKGGKGKKIPKFHVVKKGDTLQSISKQYYGTPIHWHLIADENRIKKPKNLKVGDKLKLPKIESISAKDKGKKGGVMTLESRPR